MIKAAIYTATCADVEMVDVGAGLGSGFENTNELHVMKFKEAMATKDKPCWVKAVDKEHGRMEENMCLKRPSEKMFLKDRRS